jgi:hypothetical protein
MLKLGIDNLPGLVKFEIRAGILAPGVRTAAEPLPHLDRRLMPLSGVRVFRHALQPKAKSPARIKLRVTTRVGCNGSSRRHSAAATTVPAVAGTGVPSGSPTRCATTFA